MTNLSEGDINTILLQRQQAEEQARITSIDEVIEILNTQSPLQILFSSKPSKNYSIRVLFEDSKQTEFFVRNERSNEKIKELLDTIYSRFFGPDERGSSNMMGEQYIANIMYPLAIQGRIKEVPREYIPQAIRYFEQKAVDTERERDSNKTRARNCLPYERSTIEHYSNKATVCDDSSRVYQEKADFIRMEYNILYRRSDSVLSAKA